MAAAAKHRDALLAASVRLFRQKGYAGTGLSEILQESGAPKGSLYHYFPGGKVEIGAEAVQLAGKTVTRTLKDLAAKTDGPGALVSHYLDLLAGWMAASDYREWKHFVLPSSAGFPPTISTAIQLATLVNLDR